MIATSQGRGTIRVGGGTIRADEGKFRAGEGTIRAGQDFEWKQILKYKSIIKTNLNLMVLIEEINYLK